MDRTSAPHHIDIGSGRRGFRDQNIANGQIGTRVDAPFLNSVQEEIMAVIEKAGINPDGSDWTQLWQALNRLNMPGFRGRHNWHAVKSMTLTTPPAVAEIGDAYLIAAGAQNDWAGYEGKIAIRDDDKWVFITPQDGHGIGLPEGQVFIRVAGQYQPLGQGLPGQRDNWRAIRSMTALAPPANAPTGDAYLIPEGGVGEWQGKAGQIAIRDDEAWVYITPQDGHGIGLADGSVYIRIDGQYELLQSGIPGQYNWRAVKSMTVKTPPTGAQTGDAYLIPLGSTGVWASHAGQIAIRDEDKWVFITPQDGHGLGLPDGRLFIRHGGSYREKIAADVQSGKWLYAEAGGGPDALTATLTPPPSALVDGMKIRLKPGSTNTGPVTLDINGLGAQGVVDFDGEVLAGGELRAETIIELIYNSNVGFMIASPIRASSFGYNCAYFTTPGPITWQVPKGVTLIEVEIWGGGGGSAGGENSNATGSGGGGSGAYARKRMKVQPQQTLSGVVGGGGAAGNVYGGVGGTGGTTSFAGVMSATGGSGGEKTVPMHGGWSRYGRAGAGGIASGGDINAHGSKGGSGEKSNLGGAGGMGATAPFGGGGGGNGGLDSGGGSPGGGAGGNDNLGNMAGHSGGDGAIYIKW